jgi:hypothetical protein
MRARLTILLLGLSLLLPAQTNTKMTVEQLVSFIHSSIERKQADKEVANYLRKVTLSQRLDEATLEELRSRGAGPKTVEALAALRVASKDLAPPPPPKAEPVAPPPAPMAPPSQAEQSKALQAAREYALGYSKGLPNYICLQVTRRYVDPSGTEYWHQEDVLTARLSYFEQKETYKLVRRNDKEITGDVAYQSVGGSISTGEFGSMMKEMFDPATEAEFHWERWGKLNGRIAHVFNYRVAQENSKWHVTYEKIKDIVPAYHGLVYVDRNTSMVLRIVYEAELPLTFPIQQVTDTLDYDLVPIGALGTQQYMLPLRAVVRMRQGKFLVKNEVEFRSYRKFTAESGITYDTTPEPLPASKTEEQPPNQTPAAPATPR